MKKEGYGRNGNELLRLRAFDPIVDTPVELVHIDNYLIKNGLSLETIISLQLKFYFLYHLEEDIIRFGLPVHYETEHGERFNKFIREEIMRTNRHNPSRDMAISCPKQFAVYHVVNDGSFIVTKFSGDRTIESKQVMGARDSNSATLSSGWLTTQKNNIVMKKETTVVQGLAIEIEHVQRFDMHLFLKFNKPEQSLNQWPFSIKRLNKENYSNCGEVVRCDFVSFCDVTLSTQISLRTPPISFVHSSFQVMIAEVAPYLEFFNKIVTTEYNNKEGLRDDIRQPRKKHNVIMSIKSSISTSINCICEHSGEKRIRSDRAETTNARRRKKSSCDVFINFSYGKYFYEWIAGRHHDIPDSPAAYSFNRNWTAELEEKIFSYLKLGMSAESIFCQMKGDKIKNILKKILKIFSTNFSALSAIR
ncbi:hypothetical protein EDC96DRAFT_549931 [Choanephora cucurbitarum]|nr:hypothetical protein EDC96DRAFT_549931 [Choanephora cucurbitarum]